jgi:hypothetical protein
MQPRSVDVFKAWAVYFPLKCVVVLSATRIGEGLGVLVVSDEKGLEMAWAAWAMYYTVVGGVAALLFQWTVSRFVVSRMVQEEPIHLSLFTYGRVWLVYAIATTALGYVVSQVLEFTILELMLGSLAEAPWAGWLRKSVQPISVTVVSLLVFRWTVTKLLLRDRTASASPTETPGGVTERE